jgi:eukaryotic-like serine/threonine-protein kinase
MDDLAHAIQQLRDGALERTQFFARLDAMATSANAARLLEVLIEENIKSPLTPELYKEVQQHIQRKAQPIDADETFLQTRLAHSAPPMASAPDSAEPERMKGVGDTLNGRFVLEECIGFGGMGTVYKALDKRKLEAADRKPYIAIKVLNVQFRGHPKSLVALQREARKAQALAHPNIVAVYDFDRDGSMVYLTMEYLPGKPLSQLLRAPGFTGLPYAEAMRIVNGMGKALAYAHERGFVHCDFKPANVIVMDDGNVKVIDFGIARVFHKAEEEVDVTVFDPGSLGALTPAYASPEMLEHREPDPRDDIYALACITYELLTGHHPFDRQSATEARAAAKQPQRPAKLGRAQWNGLRHALSFERPARTPSVERFLKDMGEHRPGPPVVALLASGLVLAALGGAAFHYYWPQTGPQTQATKAPPTAVARSPAAAAPSVASVLAGIPCSALATSTHDKQLRVDGFLPKSVDLARLSDALTAGAGGSTVKLNTQPVGDDKCAVISAFAPYWLAQRQAGSGIAMRLATPNAGPGNSLTEGDALMVDVTTGAAQSYVTVDYFVLDGSVVHLLPNAQTRENLAPPHYTATIGSLGNWMIARPFGTEMVLLLTTPVPLFDSARPESESRADYLRAVERNLAQMAGKYGRDKIAADFIQITTRPRQP